jgi:hypothetical protein
MVARGSPLPEAPLLVLPFHLPQALAGLDLAVGLQAKNQNLKPNILDYHAHIVFKHLCFMILSSQL